MSRAGSLALRGVLAIGLMIGFYTLAVAVAWGLVYIPYAEFVYFNRIDFRIAIFCIMGAGLVLWSIVPRPDRFQAPGPELQASQQPELFQLIDKVREATGQSAPKNVYLIPEVNAWVAQRGGLMGIGSRRVMGLGLPLMQALTVDQLRAVLAHEFGHYHGGDTMLGPWIQKTRMGLLRTVVTLSGSWIRLPFTAYAKMFFRTTNAVSRHQEFAADALAARVVGPQALAEGLKQIHRAAAAFGQFWRDEYAPVLLYKVRPPLGAGFSRFMQHKQVAAGTESALQDELATAKVNPYDSHPPLPERCAALARFEPERGIRDSRVSVALLSGLPELEADLLGIAVNPRLKEARQVAWGEVPQLVWHPIWTNQVKEQHRALKDATVADAARLCKDPQNVARQILFPPGYLPDMNQRLGQACHVVATAVAVALVDAGWRLSGDLGDPIMCTRGEDAIEPFDLPNKFLSGEITPEAWRESCDRLNVSALRLVPS